MSDTPQLVAPGLYAQGTRRFTLGPDGELRPFSPNRSKLAAYLKLGGTAWPFGEGCRVLYLGAASGTTVSHIADCCPRGRVFAVEKALRPLRELVTLCGERDNVVPLQADASMPERYGAIVGLVDVLYQDVAAPNQGAIFAANAARFCRPGALGMLMVKARSIDAAAPPGAIIDEVEVGLPPQAQLLERIGLGPFERDHAALVVRLGTAAASTGTP